MPKKASISKRQKQDLVDLIEKYNLSFHNNKAKNDFIDDIWFNVRFYLSFGEASNPFSKETRLYTFQPFSEIRLIIAESVRLMLSPRTEKIIISNVAGNNRVEIPIKDKEHNYYYASSQVIAFLCILLNGMSFWQHEIPKKFDIKSFVKSQGTDSHFIINNFTYSLEEINRIIELENDMKMIQKISKGRSRNWYSDLPNPLIGKIASEVISTIERSFPSISDSEKFLMIWDILKTCKVLRDDVPLLRDSDKRKFVKYCIMSFRNSEKQKAKIGFISKNGISTLSYEQKKTLKLILKNIETLNND